jgi:hypothetical protein
MRSSAGTWSGYLLRTGATKPDLAIGAGFSTTAVCNLK